jgi:hypothetical protein
VLRIAIIRAAVVAAFIAGPLNSVSAQGVLRMLPGDVSGRFIEAPRSVQQQLREAERALEEQRYSDAVVRLGDLLAGDAQVLSEQEVSGQDFFLEVNDGLRHGDSQPLTGSLLRTARERIGTLPAAALDTYRLRYGPLAQKLLEESVASRDWHGIGEVRRRYFHTFAGYQASALLAQHELYSGNPLAASLLLDDIVTSPPAVDHLGPGIVMLHAAACRHAGRQLPTVQAFAGQSFTSGGQSVVVPSDQELEAWLIRHGGGLSHLRSVARP